MAATGHGDAVEPPPAGTTPSAAPPIPGSELVEQAAVMNERHRTAKRAQKECADLYLLLLLHAQVGPPPLQAWSRTVQHVPDVARILVAGTGLRGMRALQWACQEPGYAAADGAGPRPA